MMKRNLGTPIQDLILHIDRAYNNAPVIQNIIPIANWIDNSFIPKSNVNDVTIIERLRSLIIEWDEGSTNDKT